MSTIFESATKVVLVILALWLTFMVCYLVVVNSGNEQLLLLLVGCFTTSVSSVLSFYFGQKSVLGTQTYDKTA